MKHCLSACGLISAAMADPQAMLVGGYYGGKACSSAATRRQRGTRRGTLRRGCPLRSVRRVDRLEQEPRGQCVHIAHAVGAHLSVWRLSLGRRLKQLCSTLQAVSIRSRMSFLSLIHI